MVGYRVVGTGHVVGTVAWDPVPGSLCRQPYRGPSRADCSISILGGYRHSLLRRLWRYLGSEESVTFLASPEDGWPSVDLASARPGPSLRDTSPRFIQT